MSKRRLINNFIGLVAVLLLCSTQVKAEQYRLVTGYLPPWSMLGNQQYPGFFVEIAREMVKRAGDDISVEVHPWGRAQTIAQTDANIVVFPMARLEHREKQYQWIAPIKEMKMSFITVNGEKLQVQAAKKLSRVLVHQAAPPEMMLKKHGFKNLVPIHDINPNVIRMMQYGRVDAWFTPLDMAKWMWKLTPNAPKATHGQPLTQHMLYVAASLKTPKSVVGKLSAILEEMHGDGTIKKIISRYRPN
ncbi:putative ABC-type amino acid transport/signal transduction systems, periplasmic component [Candidatus Terasakiella magnetica]|uniref:Putative ABC-type amino acid transport/signal transduction systems, periplasmic component n=1 Tax=Candidatus Terasakiella magnetica TaxID=1867952 RepID=A0A1C3RHY3_9PROT|nr:ABC transporter substrate-binding protein [Candidatus Terasakiella magnetica]SCA56824.1 putative ABC-type amino acid transport/signal transduction systems, periplasmic component [Candidatus Terasakiella magnetica]